MLSSDGASASDLLECPTLFERFMSSSNRVLSSSLLPYNILKIILLTISMYFGFLDDLLSY